MIPLTMPNPILPATTRQNRHSTNRLFKKARKTRLVYFFAFELTDLIFFSVSCLP